MQLVFCLKLKFNWVSCIFYLLNLATITLEFRRQVWKQEQCCAKPYWSLRQKKHVPLTYMFLCVFVCLVVNVPKIVLNSEKLKSW